MAGIRFNFDGATEFLQPGEVPTRAVTPETSIREVLSAISPEKTGFWNTSPATALALPSAKAVPFGPTPDQWAHGLLTDDVKQAVRRIEQRFGLPVSTTDADLPLDFYEFTQLDAVARTGAFHAGVVVSVFLGPSQIYAIHVARGQSLDDALRSVGAVRDYLEAYPNARWYHPVKGITLGPAEPCSLRTDLVCFSTCAYTLRPKQSWLRPFPYFNTPLAMRAGGPEEYQSEPCSNCLACVRACPASIHPSLLHHHICAGDEDAANSLGLDVCVACGWCTLACPSRLPLFATIESARRAPEEQESAS